GAMSSVRTRTPRTHRCAGSSPGKVDSRVLKALQEKLLNQELFAEFCDEFTREMNRLRMERRASLPSAKREVERIGTWIKKRQRGAQNRTERQSGSDARRDRTKQEGHGNRGPLAASIDGCGGGI